jgi:hypothetical protein
MLAAMRPFVIDAFAVAAASMTDGRIVYPAVSAR